MNVRCDHVHKPQACGAHKTSCGHAHGHAHKAPPGLGADTVQCGNARRKPFVDVLTDHPALKVLQAGTAVLMLPMIPLIGYEIYKNSSAAFTPEESMPPIENA